MTLTVAALGQALIAHDLRDRPYPEFASLAARLARAEFRFTGLETLIRSPLTGAPTRDPALVHAADAGVLDCLGALGVNLLALSNNHIFDLGTGGIVGTLAAVSERDFAFAGAGENLVRATAPALRRSANGTVALVSAATGKVRDGGAATPQRPGVNEIRRDAAGKPDESDLARNLAAVADAAGRADAVLFYHHNHDWEPDNQDTPAWQVAMARRVIDAGAALFVGHGAPLLHGIELYRGQPIFYGLGSFIFQTATPSGRYRRECWQSVIAECSFVGGMLERIELVPIVLNERGIGEADHLATRGRPHFADRESATEILERLARLSRPHGTTIEIGDGVGRIRP